jgi:hypothetical protein
VLLLGVTPRTFVQNLKTIYTNKNQVVALFFPNPIRQALVGNNAFTFSYNKENAQNVGLLQGAAGEKSNLLVITENGSVYSYLLAYCKALDTLIFFVGTEESIGMERRSNEIVVNDLMADSEIHPPVSYHVDSLMYRQEYFRRFSTYHLKHSKNSLEKKRKKGVILQLKDLVYDRGQVYAIVNLKNKFGIDYEVDYLKVYKINGNNRRKASYQKLQLESLHKQNFPNMVRDGENISFVIVLPKFTLGDSERLMFELDEQNGSRGLRLMIRPNRL